MAQHITSGSSLLVDLADDIISVIGRTLSPREICNLSMCCKSLSVPVAFDKAWLTRCEELGVLSFTDLVEWRKALSSYKALCKFLTIVKPLLGIWVHQNPELGNVVYVMPGFASIVGCRIIPQKLGPSGLEGSPILWAPVFEVISDDNGTPIFVLHGRKESQDFIYPGTVKSVDKTCNALLLEVECKRKNRIHCHSNEETDVKVLFSKMSSISSSAGENLLEIVTVGVGIQVPNTTCASLFPCLRGDEDRFRKDIAHLSERRTMLINTHKIREGNIEWNDSRENKDVELDDFVSSGDTIGLTLQAPTMDLSFYQDWAAWPDMDDCLLALYKLPMQVPTVGQEYAGLWGGTFGNKQYGNALFVVVLCYHKEPRRQRRLIATKILEGTDYVEHPNGSTMFTVNLDEPSSESFRGNKQVKQAFTGEGITSGNYGFRYSGSTPGLLFVLEDGVLAFLWKETGMVLTLERLDLEELLKKGERVPAIPPIPNFSFLDRFYTNVFAELETMKLLGFC